jgi:hypothetical protein
VFRALDLDRLGALMKQRRLIDLRNVYSREVVESAGFTYSGVGTRSTAPVRDQVGEAGTPLESKSVLAPAS